MKKFLFSCLTLALSVSMFAINYTDKVTIALYDGTHASNLIVGESSDEEFAGGALVNGCYAPVQDLASMPSAVYAYYGNVEYENLILNSLVNVPVGVKTNNALSYTFYFAGLEGTVSIYDKEKDVWLDCTAAYPFTISSEEKNSYINNRFYLFYVAPVTAYNVTLNDDYLATFSAAEDVEIPAGLTAWYSVDGIENDALTLLQVSGKIPANTGVVLYNANGDEKNFSLPITTGADAIATNLLKPASAWASHSGTIYILHGHELWVYEGTEMKENKAYLQINTTSAPARIRLAFGQTTGVENVEAEAVKAEKFVENGQIFIRRGNEVFNLQGQVVK